MPRVLPAQLRTEVDQPWTGEFLAIFAVVSHPDLIEPIRAANDVVDYILGGLRYTGVPFEMEALTDGERPPSGRLRIHNVDRRLGEVVLALKSPPRLRIDIYAGSDWGPKDTGQNARLPIGTPVPWYSAPGLRLRNVTVDAMAVSGEVVSYDPTSEPWPSVRATRDRLPGLFR